MICSENNFPDNNQSSRECSDNYNSEIHKETSLLSAALKGLKITAALTILKTVIDLSANVILARWLAPEVFGVVAFAIAFSGFFSLFCDMNAQRWIIKNKNLSSAEISSAFTFELLLSLIVAALWFFISEPLLKSIGNADAAPYAKLLSVWIVTERLMIPKAVFERDMNFRASNTALFWGVFSGASSSVIFAFLGYGGYSIIYGMIIRSAAAALVLWITSPVKFRLYIDFQTLKKLFKFGLPLSTASIMVFFYSNVDYVIVGKVLGETALGYYFIAYKFPHYIHQLQMLVSSVAFPAFSRSKDKAQMQRGFALATKYSAAVSLPLLAVTIVFGKEVVKYLLGEKWLPAVVPFQIFMAVSVVRIITVYWHEVYVASGKTGIIPALTAINSIGITALGFLGAKYFSIEGAACGVAITVLFTILLATQLFLKRILNVSYLKILKIPLLYNMVFFLFLILIKVFLLYYINFIIFWIVVSFCLIFYSVGFTIIDKRELKNVMEH